MHIAIAGNIGSGKTTLTKMLAKRYNWSPRFEPVEHNPYLDDFYKDMSRWSFNLQIYSYSVGESNNESHNGCNRHVHDNYAAARVEVAHRNEEAQAQRITNLCDDGYEVGLVLAHPHVVTYHLQKRLVIVAVGHSQSCNNGHREQQAAFYAFIFFQLFHFLFFLRKRTSVFKANKNQTFVYNLEL